MQDQKGTRLQTEILPEDWAQFCIERRPELNPAEVFAEFEDHFKSKSGKDGVKLDWLRTWRNWVRRTYATPSNRTADLSKGPASQSRAALESLQNMKKGQRHELT